MENTDNQNTVNHIVLTKLFKSSFAGASGNNRGDKTAGIHHEYLLFADCGMIVKRLVLFGFYVIIIADHEM